MVSEFTIGLGMVVAGIVLIIVEASSPGFFIAIPATVLIALGMIAMAVPGFLLSLWSPVLALLVAVPATILTMLFYQRLSPPQPPTTTVAHSLIGKTGIVLTKVKPDAITGKVKIENQTWSATADTVIPEGTKVQVISSEGVHVVVRPMAANPGGP